MSFSNHKQGSWVFVAGPSGAGKDTVIDYARSACAANVKIQVARRLVTRAPNEFEDHDSLSTEEFERRRSRGEFILCWQAHDLSYGIAHVWQEKVAAGSIIICNVSRTLLPDMANRVAGRFRTVLVTAPSDVLAARITARGRDPANGSRTGRDLDGDIRQIADLVIENTGTPEQAGNQFVELLNSISRQASL